jgi:hypothetical protein
LGGPPFSAASAQMYQSAFALLRELRLSTNQAWSSAV